MKIIILMLSLFFTGCSTLGFGEFNSSSDLNNNQSLDSSGKLKLSEFPSDEVVGHIQEQRSGYTLAKDKLIVYYRMPALGWYYVIRGDKEQLLHMAY